MNIEERFARTDSLRWWKLLKYIPSLLMTNLATLLPASTASTRPKMDCFLTLSTGTTEEEKLDFIAYDISREVEKTLERFDLRPEEKAENLPAINRIVFCESDDDDKPLDILVVLGSNHCEHNIRRAWEIGRLHPGIKHIVSSGNISTYGCMTEVEYK